MKENCLYQPEEVLDFKHLLKRTVKLYGNKVAFIYKKNPEAKNPVYIQKTYCDFQSDINGLGTRLLDLGLENKRVAIIAPNRYEWCVSYLAITTANIVVVPLDKSLPENEIESLILRSEVEAIIFDSKYLDILEKIREKNISNLKHYICMDFSTSTENILSYFQLVQDGKNLISSGDKRLNNIIIDKNKMTSMLFTSGTTSISQAVMLSQSNICSNINQIRSIVNIKPENVFLSFLPLHHTFECSCTFLTGITCGITIAFCDGLKHVTQNLKEYKITGFVCVPLMLEAMYKKIMKGIEKSGKTKLINFMVPITNFLAKCGINVKRKVYKEILDQLGGHLDLIIYGAAPMSKEVIKGLTSFGLRLDQGYGLTETSPVLCGETDRLKKPGSCGVPLKGVDLKIINPDENGIGEIIASGPNIMLGYYNNEEATKEALQDGYFHTGDLGYLDKDGCIFVTGRKKSVIVLKNGKNIFPEELETLINKLPFVEESIVYGKPTKDGDLDLCAKIVYNEQLLKEVFPEAKKENYYDIILKEVKQINKTMPAYKYIRQIMVTEEPLIKTTTQKVKRHEEIKKILG